MQVTGLFRNDWAFRLTKRPPLGFHWALAQSTGGCVLTRNPSWRQGTGRSRARGDPVVTTPPRDAGDAGDAGDAFLRAFSQRCVRVVRAGGAPTTTTPSTAYLWQGSSPRCAKTMREMDCDVHPIPGRGPRHIPGLPRVIPRHPTVCPDGRSPHGGILTHRVHFHTPGGGAAPDQVRGRPLLCGRVGNYGRRTLWLLVRLLGRHCPVDAKCNSPPLTCTFKGGP